MKRAIALITGGAGGAGDAQDPSRTIASERALNAAIVATDISHSSEEYLEIFDHFYAEDIEGTTDTMKEPVHGKAACVPGSRVSPFRFTYSPRLAACPFRFSRAPSGETSRMRRTQSGRSGSAA
jgi:hypothetical protein